jgi:ADP-heptose:LPS heptosyltransferase/GT2 family glycosyltransferase/SAM-dependent methyltransferase
MQDGTGLADVFGIIAHCEYPNLDTAQVVSAVTEVSGWVISDWGIEDVEVSIDGISWGKAEYGLPRPDVGGLYGQIPGSGESGFRFRIDTCRLPDGERELRVRISDRRGGAVVLSGAILVDNSGWSRIKQPSRLLIPEELPSPVFREQLARYAFMEQIVQGRKVLDLGAGVGYGTQYLALSGATLAVGLDASEEAIRYASLRYSRKGGASYVVADTVALPFKDGAFDVVVAGGGLHCAGDGGRPLGEARRVLHETGVLAVSADSGSMPGPDDRPPRAHTHELSAAKLACSLQALFPAVRVYAERYVAGLVFLDRAEMCTEAREVDVTLNSRLTVPGMEPRHSIIVATAREAYLPRPVLAQTQSAFSIQALQDQLDETQLRLSSFESSIMWRALQRLRNSGASARLGQLSQVLAGYAGLLWWSWRREGTKALVTTAFHRVPQLLTARQRRVYLWVDWPDVAHGPRPSLTGTLALRGWALAPNGIARVRIYCDGELVGTPLHGSPRKDVAKQYPLIPDSDRSGFSFLWDTTVVSDGVHVLKVEAEDQLGSSTHVSGRVEIVNPFARYDRWLSEHMVTAALTRWMCDASERLPYRPLFDIVLGGHECDTERLLATLRSVLGQAYPHWRMRVMIGSNLAGTAGALEETIGGDPRVQILRDHSERAAWCDSGFSEEAGEFLACLQEGAVLQPHALFEVARELNLDDSLDLIYSDHDHIDVNGSRSRAFFKPDWSPDLLLSTNYIGRFFVVRKALAAETGVIDYHSGRAGFYDLLLRMTERTARIGHIPTVLCSHLDGAEPQAPVGDETENLALQDAIQRRAIDGQVIALNQPGRYRVKRVPHGRPKVSIAVPSRLEPQRLKRCLESIAAKTSYANYEILVLVDRAGKSEASVHALPRVAHRVIESPNPFSWSRLNNLAAQQASGEYLVFLHDDTEVISPGWLEAMLEHAQRDDVAAVGAMLVRPDGFVQHAGYILTDHGTGAKHAFAGLPAGASGYIGLLNAQRNCSGVSGACMMALRERFLQLGGFDEHMEQAHADLDFCLRAREQGYLVMWTPYAVLTHHALGRHQPLDRDNDGAGFWYRWRDAIEQGDPYYNPNLTQRATDFSLNPSPVLVEPSGLPPVYPEEVQRILVVKLDHIGDVVLSLPAIRLLRCKFPNAHITAMVGSWAKAVLEGERCVDAVITYDFFQTESSRPHKNMTPTDRRELAEYLASSDFDLAIDLRKTPETREFLRLSGAGYTVGYDDGSRYKWMSITLAWDEPTRSQPAKRHIVDETLYLVHAIPGPGEPGQGTGLPLTAEERRQSTRLLQGLLPSSGRLVVGVHPAVGNPIRRWPAEHFARLADKLIGDLGADVVFCGASGDVPLVDGIRSKMRHHAFSVAGEVSLRQFIGLAERFDLLIGNVSAAVHIAAAQGVPTLAIFGGQVDPQEWSPRGASVTSIRLALPCSPCFRGSPSECPWVLECLSGLSVEKVWEAVCRALVAEGHRLPAGLVSRPFRSRRQLAPSEE